jgi:NTE family protein
MKLDKQRSIDRPPLPGQVVLVLQGGGALGAYQVGVCEALHEAGIEPDWVIGTSIGAINGALLAGNRPGQRLERLHEFWARIESAAADDALRWWSPLQGMTRRLDTMLRGVPGFFSPNAGAWLGPHAPLGVDAASYYSTAPLHATLRELIDFNVMASQAMRLTVGAVNVRTGAMRYFDSRDGRLGVEHVMASGALPPAFPAIRVDGQPYWDGGLYSNTPIEAVLDDRPRRDSVIFSVNVWRSDGLEPQSIWEVMGRQKDIQYGSRADSHIARQKQIHHLRHVIRELERRLPPRVRSSAEVRELGSWGCSTTMHVVRLLAPGLAGEDQLKDIDFSADTTRTRRRSGYADARQAIESAPWQAPVDPAEGVIVHTLGGRR